MEDRTSELPEEILVKILSLLPAGRDAIVTSVLSRRWRYLWTCVSNLNFDGHQYMMNKKKNLVYDSDLEVRKFIKWVNNVINQRHDGQKIDTFRVYFDLDRSSASSIDTWVKFAIGRDGLQIFMLEFPQFGGFRRYTPCYVLHRRVFDCQDNVSFNSLRVLRFTCVDLNDEVFHYLLCKCSVLERLEVHGSSTLVNPSVAGPSLALKHLGLQNCENIESIEIYDAGNLVSFYCCCDNPYTRLVIEDVPMLAEVYFHCYRYKDVGSVFTALSSCLWQLQILQLNISIQDYVENRVYTTLTNLKQLNLMLNGCDNYNLLKLIPFIKAFPYMNKLVLKLLSWGDLKPQEWHKSMKPTKCPHQNLKEVEVFGYTGRTSDDELITYFIENADLLEKIVIKSFQFMEFPSCKPFLTKKEEEMTRDHAMKHLKGKVPSTVEFICP